MEKSEKSFEKILEVQQKIQKLFPECVLVGRSAVAMKRKHRVSFDADNIMEELKQNFERILEKLESLSGWKTKRLRPPVLILGRFEGIDVGIRQLIRKKPLEIEIINGIKIPTDKELLRIKAWLIVTRNAVRDYVDFIALCDGMSKEDVLDAILLFDRLFLEKGDADDPSPHR